MKCGPLIRFALLIFAGPLTAREAPSADLFPFVIPGLTPPPKGSVVDLSYLNEGVAGADGFVRVRDGRFVDGKGKRVRFLATNVTFGTCFPDHATADRLAARFASLGLNCIRFHHMDNQAAPRGIWKAGTPWKNGFDPEQLDRLDYFIAALKRHGVFTNLNLHVSRNYWEGEEFADGLKDQRERQTRLPHYGKGLDKIDDQMIRMQKDYARALLTHVNPYTKTAYAKEPAVVIVEINNENTLLQLNAAELPGFYQAGIRRKWNEWLERRHGTTEALKEAWGGSEPLGSNILAGGWRIQGGEYVSASSPAADGVIRVGVGKVPATSWHAQLHWPGLTLQEGKLYTVEVTARSDVPRRVPMSVRLDKEDWHNCGLSETLELGPEWRTFRHAFRATKVVPGALRLDLVAGAGPAGAFDLKNLSLRRGGSLGLGQGESIEKGSVDLPARVSDTPRGRDWVCFLAETERAYTEAMRAFLKKDLGVEAAIIDTQASYGGVAGAFRESRNDFIDMHAYWQHPRFPGKPWDSSNWSIANTPMVEDRAGGNLMRLGVYRVSGLPFTVSEYDHPAPSDYSAEMFPMIASFAALQDWDGLFQFDWGGTDSDARRISGYFSLQQHPGKLAFLPAAALMFRRGDVAPASGTATLTVDPEDIVSLAARNVQMPELWKQHGLTPEHVLTHRLGVRFAVGEGNRARISPTGSSVVAWNSDKAVFTVDAPAAKVVAGRCVGATTGLTDCKMHIRSGRGRFAVVALNAVDGKRLRESGRMLLVAAGGVENTGMVWNEDRTSVGTRWGTAPTVGEGIAAELAIVSTAKSATVHALDGAGQRVAELPCRLKDGLLSFEIGPRDKTLWYEITPR